MFCQILISEVCSQKNTRYTHKCIQTDVFLKIKTSFNIKKEKIDKSSYVSKALVVIYTVAAMRGYKSVV